MIVGLFITVSIVEIVLCERNKNHLPRFWMQVQADGEEPHAIVQVYSNRVREKQSVITDRYEFSLKSQNYIGRNYFNVPVSDCTKECFVVHKNGLDEGIMVKPYEEWYRLF